MNTWKIVKYSAADIFRSKWLLIYTLILFLFTEGLLYFSGNETKTILSVLSVMLYLIPLVSIIFSSMHYYNSREFIEMLLTQPLRRSSVYWGEYFSISLSLSAGFIVGVVLPLLFNGISAVLAFIFMSGLLLNFIFTGLALLISVAFDEKLRGMGFLVALWLFFTVLYDGLVLLMYFTFSDYPLEKITLLVTALNPVDITRVMVLMNLEISALFGYTGANFQKFFGTASGIGISLLIMLLWVLVPALSALRKFGRKNF